jgi:hypothetical protein
MDCELIAKLATDLKKRAFFAKLAVQLKAMARDIEGAVACELAPTITTPRKATSVGRVLNSIFGN